MKAFGIVVAAGSGTRFGGPKASVELGGIAMWERARVSLLEGGCDPVVVVGDVPGGVPGGRRRRDSVRAGLDHAPSDATHVLVHDAARPLASSALAERIIDRLVGGSVAVVPVVPVRDTIKRVRGDEVIETVDRSELVVVQTPQGFALEVLVEAHFADDGDASDDALLVERTGGTVDTIPGEPANLKITYPGDLAVAEALLS